MGKRPSEEYDITDVREPLTPEQKARSAERSHLLVEAVVVGLLDHHLDCADRVRVHHRCLRERMCCCCHRVTGRCRRRRRRRRRAVVIPAVFVSFGRLGEKSRDASARSNDGSKGRVNQGGGWRLVDSSRRAEQEEKGAGRRGSGREAGRGGRPSRAWKTRQKQEVSKRVQPPHPTLTLTLNPETKPRQKPSTAVTNRRREHAHEDRSKERRGEQHKILVDVFPVGPS